MKFDTVKVLGRQRLSPEMLELILKKPFDFKAGQYLFIRFQGKDYPFSIASSPSTAMLILHIQHSPHHPLPQAFWADLNAASTIDVSEAAGEAYLRLDSSKPLLFIAGGSGFAPIHSMLDTLATQKSTRPIHFYWGVRHSSLLYGEDSLARWQAMLPHFSWTPVVSGDEPSWIGRTGFVHEAPLADHLNVDQCDIYVAGPAALTEAALKNYKTIYSDAMRA